MRTGRPSGPSDVLDPNHPSSLVYANTVEGAGAYWDRPCISVRGPAFRAPTSEAP